MKWPSKPLDKETILRYTEKIKAVVTAEEHAPFGGMGSMAAQAVAECCPRKIKLLFSDSDDSSACSGYDQLCQWADMMMDNRLPSREAILEPVPKEKVSGT